MKSVGCGQVAGSVRWWLSAILSTVADGGGIVAALTYVFVLGHERSSFGDSQSGSILHPLLIPLPLALLFASGINRLPTGDGWIAGCS